MGHGFGGATALDFAKESNVKAVVALDPYLLHLERDIDKGLKITKPCTVVNSQIYHKQRSQFMSFKSDEVMNKLIQNSKSNNKFVSLEIPESGHY